MNEERYRLISNWFRKNKKRLSLFVFLYKVLPYLIAVSYLITVGYAIFTYKIEDCIRIVLVPMITFLLCTIMRKCINKKRPYELLDIEPLIKKQKKGQSFPSRHMVSAGVIAISAMYVNIYFGIFVMSMGVCIGILRPIAGVHFIKDVTLGFMIGIVCGLVGFYLL